MIIELKVFCLNDEQQNQYDMGYDTPLDDCELRIFAFVRIDYFSQHRKYPDYTIVSSSNQEFICKHTYNQVKILVDVSQPSKLN